MSTPARGTVADAHPVLDGHNDLPWALRELVGAERALDVDLQADTSGRGLHTDLDRMRQGSVGGQFWSVYVPSSLPEADALVATLEQVDLVHLMVGRYADRLALATSADEVEEAMGRGLVASLLGAEGGHSLAGSLGALRCLHRLGVRYLTLTHNHNTAWADSATDLPEHGGLTGFGREVVREMNRLGMLVDLSHVAATTMRDALATSTAPVIFSHSNAQALCSSPRNVPDDVLEQLAAGGGVCMATFVPQFVAEACWAWKVDSREAARSAGIDPNDHPAMTAFSLARQQEHPRPQATLAQVADHLDHLREVAGVDHVGLGGDFDGTEQVVLGLEDVSTYPALLSELGRRGWSSADLAGLTHGNVLRVLRAAEAVAQG
ncbi:dipeptidase [Serinicoccus kebangsaanensis]|uniref:dipeptidase n=1 Tax=Serinicoccus kebangsaanensis TaxID=2602069 RepID=UPI001EE1E380|nr:dipeptidase [Serinicoccus kebangsaanensis]